MNVVINTIADKGSIQNERVVVKALVDVDIGRYGIFRTGKSATGITNSVYNTYWFPDRQVRAGDLIVLYTKAGVYSVKRNLDGSDAHFYYWGLSAPLWNGNFGTVIVSTPEWQVYPG